MAAYIIHPISTQYHNSTKYPTTAVLYIRGIHSTAISINFLERTSPRCSRRLNRSSQHLHLHLQMQCNQSIHSDRKEHGSVQERRIGSATFGSHPPALYLPTDVRSCLSSPSVPTYVVVLRGYPVCETKTLELLAHRTTIESQQETAIALRAAEPWLLAAHRKPLGIWQEVDTGHDLVTSACCSPSYCSHAQSGAGLTTASDSAPVHPHAFELLDPVVATHRLQRVAEIILLDLAISATR